MHELDTFFNPKSVAVIGASRDPKKLGHMVFKNIIEHGFPGKTYPVNPSADEILNHNAYKQIDHVPYDVDVAIIVIPRKFVVQAMKQCADKKVKGVVIITAGFSELDDEGKVLEEQIKEIGKSNNIRILGPNCLGFINSAAKLNASFGKSMPKPGNIKFVSQSGAFGTALLDWALDTDIGFDLFVSVGNKADIGENDMLEYWNKIESEGLVVSYLENIRDGKKFNQLNKVLTKRAPHLVLVPGKSAEARAAIQSHTGALASSDELITTALEQFGATRLEGLHELYDSVRLFANQSLLNGDRIAIITNAGGPAVMTTDEIYTQGLKVAKFEKRTLDILAEQLPREAAIFDPVDIVGDALADRYAVALDTVLGDPNVDGVVILLSPQIMTQMVKTADHIIRLSKEHKDKVVTAAYIGGAAIEEGKEVLESNGVPIYHAPGGAVKALSYMNKYRQYLANQKSSESIGSDEGVAKLDVSDKLFVENIFERAKVNNESVIDPNDALEVAARYGITVPESKKVNDEDDAVRVAQEIGYPVVMKVSSSKFLHKVDIGGVHLNITNENEVRMAYKDISQAILTQVQGTNESVSGNIEVQEMIKGSQEVIVGVKYDDNFGHLLLFGLGGIYTEIFKDISTRFSPINTHDAKEMIRSTRVHRIMSGYRNMPVRDISSVADVIVKVSRMVTDFPQIKEMDINPLLVKEKGQGSIAVDVKIKI